jgi:hypothetical protein
MIRIWVNSSQPPCGRVVMFEGQPARVFAGWLDLLGILADGLATGGNLDSPADGASDGTEGPPASIGADP